MFIDTKLSTFFFWSLVLNFAILSNEVAIQLYFRTRCILERTCTFIEIATRCGFPSEFQWNSNAVWFPVNSSELATRCIFQFCLMFCFVFHWICFLNFPVNFFWILGKKTSSNYWKRIFTKKLGSILMGMNIKIIVAFAIRLKKNNQITMRYSQVVNALDP